MLAIDPCRPEFKKETAYDINCGTSIIFKIEFKQTKHIAKSFLKKKRSGR